jgi:hypothetical protein
MPVHQRTPIEQQSTASVVVGLLISVLASMMSFALAIFVLFTAQAVHRNSLLAVVGVICCFGLVWLCPAFIAYKELRRRRRQGG